MQRMSGGRAVFIIEKFSNRRRTNGSHQARNWNFFFGARGIDCLDSPFPLNCVPRPRNNTTPGLALKGKSKHFYGLTIVKRDVIT